MPERRAGLLWPTTSSVRGGARHAFNRTRSETRLHGTHRLQDLFLVCDRIQVMYEGRNVAERRIGETNIEEVVDLIVGRKFSARSARHAPSPEGRASP